jgi:glycosyltransferase involved in cell wall biosynthesis
MKVFYDHQIYSSQVYGGVSRYFYELINLFGDNEQIDPLLDVRFSNNYYIRNLGTRSPYSFFKNWNFSGKNRILERINRLHTLSLLKKNDYDIFHPTFYNPYFIKHLDGKPFVLTVMDFIHEFYPELPNAAGELASKKTLIEKAERIICISQNTKNDLLKLYDVPKEKVDVIYLAQADLGTSDKQCSVAFPEKFILFMGQRKYYKNFKVLLKSFSKISKEFPDCYLFCAGGGSFNQEEISLIEKFSVTNKLMQFNLSDYELKCAYQKAQTFVFPSDYEGFGIPTLEAFANGCPVILSNASCFSEIGGEAAMYFEKNCVEDLSSKMIEVLQNKDLRDNLIAKGAERNKQFSWEKTTAKTLELYKKVLENNE